VFADPDVEAVVRVAVAMPSGPISAGDVAGLKQLELVWPDVPACPSSDYANCIDYMSAPHADHWVTSLAGVECLTNLESLAVDAFALNLDPLRALPHLNNLFLGPVVGSKPPPLPQVKTLECSAVPVSGFISAFAGLATLTIHGVDVPSGAAPIEVWALPDLTELSIANSGLADLAPLAGLTNLLTLDLSGNEIHDLRPLAPLTKLVTIDLAQNEVTDLSPLLKMAGLGVGSELDLTGNPLDCAAQASNLDALRARLVKVDADCP
jgi:internalin A